MAKAHADADEAVDGREAKGPPQSVLLDAVLRAVGDAELLGALFTTYRSTPASSSTRFSPVSLARRAP